MLLKYFYDPALAHASYLLGCQQTGEAVVVDPARDIEPYLSAARSEGMRVVGAVETHIQADYVSGARELAERVGAKLYLSDEGSAEWKYEFASRYPSRLLKQGDRFWVGRVQLQAMHTPGHTPEHLSYLVTDIGGGASRPMGAFTGDFVFVNAVGRPDLLQTAVGLAGSAEAGARTLFRALEAFKKLPDYLQIWPSHGAGSACGKGLGAIPSSTVGYEKLFNPGLQFDDESAFVEYILADQPEAPPYFATMKRVNRAGPAVLGEGSLPVQSSPDALSATAAARKQIVDTRHPVRFAAGHVPGSINIPIWALANWAGWLVDYEQPLYLIAPDGDIAEATRVLRKIGVDRLAGWFDAQRVEAAGLNRQTYRRATPAELVEAIESGRVQLIDVRSEQEWRAGRIPQAEHRYLGRLPQRLGEGIGPRPVVLQCRTGVRSAIAASLLQAAGIENVINMDGGFVAWAGEGFPVEMRGVMTG